MRGPLFIGILSRRIYYVNFIYIFFLSIYLYMYFKKIVDLEGHIRIGDFGLSKPDMDVNEFAYSFCGSPEYMVIKKYINI